MYKEIWEAAAGEMLIVRLTSCIDHAACLYRSSPSPLPCSQERLPARADKKITTPWDREDRPSA